jgi:hypothetical protein
MVTTGTLSDLCYHFIEPSQLSAWLMGIQPPSGMTSGTVVIHFPKRLLELYTHCTRQEIIVKQAIDGELERSLVARRSAMAIQQLGQVNVILAQQSLNHGRDQRKSALLKRNGELDTSLIYKALKSANSSPDAWTKFVWNKAPPRVKFFAWLLAKGRIQCKSNLQRKGVVQTSTCELCNATDETPAHLIFGCPFAAQFWSALHIQTDQNWPVSALMQIQKPNQIPSKHCTTFLAPAPVLLAHMEEAQQCHLQVRKNNPCCKLSCLQIRGIPMVSAAST